MHEDRIRLVTEQARGMLYCVSRSGVTGQQATGEESTKMQHMQRYLKTVRQFTSLPLAVGFGINTREDIAALKGHADVAIVGSAFLNAFNNEGLHGVLKKLNELRQ